MIQNKNQNIIYSNNKEILIEFLKDNPHQLIYKKQNSLSYLKITKIFRAINLN